MSHGNPVSSTQVSSHKLVYILPVKVNFISRSLLKKFYTVSLCMLRARRTGFEDVTGTSNWKSFHGPLMNTIEKSRFDSGYFPVLFYCQFQHKTDIFHCTVYYDDFEIICEVKRSPDYEIQLKVRAENLR